MSNTKFLDIVRNSFLQDKLLTESRLEEIIMSNTPIDKKVKKIREAIEEYSKSTLNMSFWEEYINKNIIIPEQNSEGNNKPEGEN